MKAWIRGIYFGFCKYNLVIDEMALWPYKGTIQTHLKLDSDVSIQDGLIKYRDLLIK